MLLYRLAKWMEEQENGKEQHVKAKERSADAYSIDGRKRNANDHFPIMKQEVERFREQVPY